MCPKKKSDIKFIVAFILLFSSACFTITPSGIRPNTICIKIKELPVTLSKNEWPDIPIKTLGITSLDDKLKKTGAVSIKRRFRYCEFTENDLIGINRIFSITLPEEVPLDEVLELYSQDPNVEYAEPMPVIVRDAIPDDSLYGEQFYLRQIHAEQAWDLHRGEAGPQVVIAIVDDAVDWRHPDLVGNVWQNLAEDADHDGHVIENNGQWQLDPDDLNGIDDDGNGFIDDLIGWDFINSNLNEDNDPGPEVKQMVHGTHVAGLAAGMTNNGKGIASIGWNVKFMACKHDRDGENPYDSDLYDGVVFAANHQADIINMSWGSSSYLKASEDIIRYAWSKGCILVGTAGNDDWELPHYPSDHSNVLSVAAVTSQDKKTSYSSYGLTVDICAPGGEYWIDNAILSTHPEGYSHSQGTSMAAPIISGALALVKSYYPNDSRERIITQVLATADEIDSKNPDYSQKLGYGLINACHALSNTNATLPQVLRLKIDKLTPDDANGNLALEKGETARLNFRIYNYTPFMDDPSASFTLSTQDPDIEIINGSYHAAIPADASITLQNAFEIKISENAQSHIASLTLKIESNKIIAGGNEINMKYVIGAGGVLVWEPSPSDPNTSGTYIYQFLKDHDFDAIYINDFPDAFSGFDAVFLCFGTGSETYPIFSEQMSDAVIAYLLQHGKLYMEGTPKNTRLGQNSSLLLLLGIQNIGIPGSDIVIHQMTGQNGTLTEGMEFLGSAQPDQRVLQLFPRKGAQSIFQENRRGIVGTWYKGTFQQKVFVLSYALSQLTDGDLPSTRAMLLTGLLNNFELLPAPFFVTDFRVNPQTGHAPLSVELTDLSFSVPNSSVTEWQWDFDEDNHTDAFTQSPEWTFTENGVYNIRLRSADKNFENVCQKNEYIQIFNGTSALNFNGGTSFVQSPASDSLNFTDAFTFEAWIYPRSWGEEPGFGYGRLMDKEVISIFLHNDSGIYNGQCLVMTIDTPNGGYSAVCTPCGSIMLHQWSHVAIDTRHAEQIPNQAIQSIGFSLGSI